VKDWCVVEMGLVAEGQIVKHRDTLLAADCDYRKDSLYEPAPNSLTAPPLVLR